MKNNGDDIFIPLTISIAAHLAFVILFFFMPSLFSKKLPEEQIITLEMLPIADVSNVKTQKVQKDKAIEAEDAKKVLKTKEEQPKAVEPKPEPKKDIPKEVVPESKKPDVKKEQKPKEDKQTKPDAKPKKKKISNEVELESLMKTLEKASEGKSTKSNKQARSDKTDADKDSHGPFDNLLPLSITEFHAIRQQIERHWNVPVGAQNAGAIKITLYISLKSDGTVEQVKLIDKRCPADSAALCEAAADGALRAVWLASPLQNLAPENYESWKELNIEFDPSEIAG